MSSSPLPHSLTDHFSIDTLADGVFVALAKVGGAALANAGIVDLGDRVLLFDTTLTPVALNELLGTVRWLTGKSVCFAINSHWHDDHTWGNGALPPEAILVATERTRQIMQERLPAMIKESRRVARSTLAELEGRLVSETDTDRRTGLHLEVGRWRGLVASLPQLKLRLPDITFAEKISFFGSKRQAEVVTFGGGHSASDAILYLPQERIVFTADLVTVQCHPWLGEADLEGWPRILEQIEGLGPEQVVPGHGPVGTLADVAATRQYVETLPALVGQAVNGSGGESRVARLPLPAAFTGWQDPGRFYQENLASLYRRLAAG